MYAVTIEPLNATFFLAERPAAGGEQVQEGVDLDLPVNYDAWPEGSRAPEHVLCRSTVDERHFKVFRYADEVDPCEFQPTGKNFGGIYSRTSWERFVKNLPALLAFRSIAEDDSSGTGDQAISSTGGAR